MSKFLTDSQFVQYYRQLMLPQVEESGQHTLLHQHVLIVGAGGLGTHVAQQLTGAGVGHIHLIDDDRVEASNLPRQILFDQSDVGQLKVDRVKKRLNQQNRDTTVYVYHERFESNSFELLTKNNPALEAAVNSRKLLVLDCSDNMPTRQAVNQWCVNNKLTLVSAAISAYSGQLLLVDAKQITETGCYRCIFNEQHQTQGCENMGVLGPAVGVMASMQCMLALNHLLKTSTSPPHLHLFDGLDLSWRKLLRRRDPMCPVCQHVKTHLNHETSL